MGNTNVTSAPPLNKLPMNLEESVPLSKARFLKTYRCQNKTGNYVIKAFFKPPGFQGGEYVERLKALKESLDCPHTSPILECGETDTFIYTIRPYFHSSLYKRIGTRPFLTPIEKRWLTYQILYYFKEAEKRSLKHGDLKCENIMVTSWNWIFVTDHSCVYKPTFLSEENSGEFSYFFDTSTKRVCYIAPERFHSGMSGGYSSGSTKAGQTEAPTGGFVSSVGSQMAQECLTTKMDVFSAGCVIAELWLEDVQLFDYSTLLSYRAGKSDPLTTIERIEDADIRELVAHMTGRRSSDRLTGTEYFEDCVRRQVFPAYFRVLHQFFSIIMKYNPDQRVRCFAHSLSQLHAHLSQGEKSYSCRELPLGVRSSKEEECTRKVGFLEMCAELAAELDVFTRTELCLRMEMPTDLLGRLIDPGGDEPLYLMEYLREKGYLTPESVSAVLEVCEGEPGLKKLEKVLRGYERGLRRGEAAEEMEERCEMRYESLKKEGVMREMKKLGESCEAEERLEEASLHLVGSAMRAEKLGDSLSVVQRELDEKGGGAMEGGGGVETELGEESMEMVLELAKTKREMADFRGALKLHGEYLSRCESLKDEERWQTGKIEQGMTYRELGLLDQAMQSFEAALTVRSGNRRCELMAYAQLSRICAETKQYQLSIQYQDRYNELKQKEGVLVERGSYGGEGRYEGYVIILNALYSMLRHLNDLSTKLVCLDCFQRINLYVSDQVRLQMLVPYVVSMIDVQPREPSPLVRAQSIRTLTKVVSLVTSLVDADDALLFPEYLLPVLSFFYNGESEELVLQAYAESLGTLAQSAKRLIELSYCLKEPMALRAAMEYASSDYMKELQELREIFREMVTSMLGPDASMVVRKAVIDHLAPICDFFGFEMTKNTILPLVFSCLNGEWELKCAVFDNMPGVGRVVGPDSVRNFVFTFVPTALREGSEFVVNSVVNCLASLCEAGMFDRWCIFEVCRWTAPLLLHPNAWIRFSACAVMVRAQGRLSWVDVQYGLVPILRRFLKRELASVTEESLLQSLESPVSRQAFERAIRNQTSYTCEKEEGLELERKGDEMDVPFSLALAELRLDEEEERKLFLMKEYIKRMSREATQEQRVDHSGSWAEEYKAVCKSVGTYRLGYIEGRAAGSECVEAHPEVVWKQMDTKFEVESVEVEGAWVERECDKVEGGGGQNAATCSNKSPVVEESSSPELSRQRRESVADSLRGPSGLGPCASSKLAKDWRPHGMLVASLHEHEDVITQLGSAKDGLFFASGSYDGTVRIWNCQEMLKSFKYKSSGVYEQFSPITSIAICEDTRAVASASIDGAIHLFRVEYISRGSRAACSAVRKLENGQFHDEVVLKLFHFERESESLLIYATDRGKIYGWDIRIQRESWILDNKPHSGVITSIVIDPTCSWMVVSTDLGVFTCWDLRFHVLLQRWQISTFNSPVHSMSYCHFSQNNRIWASPSNDVLGCWDLSTLSCKRVYCICPPHSSVHPFVEQLDQTMLSVPTTHENDFCLSRLQKAISQPLLDHPHPFECLYSSPHSTFLLTAGTDRTIRYLDLNIPSNSLVISHPDPNQPQPTYSTLSTPRGLQVTLEQPVLRNPHPSAHLYPSPAHLDAITDISLFETPLSTSILTSSRDGIIKIWK